MSEEILRRVFASSDSRGWVVVWEFKGQEILMIYTKKGYMRGGEIHKGRQWNVILQGAVDWTIGFESLYKKESYYAPAYIAVPKDQPHMMEALTDTLMIEWREYPLEEPVNYYKPFRDKIIERREQLEKKKIYKSD